MVSRDPGVKTARPCPASARIRAAGEGVLFFVLPPLLIRLAPFPIPKIPTLLFAAALCLALLLRDPAFDRKRLGLSAFPTGEAKGIFLRSLFVGGLLAAAIGFWEPALFFSLPQQRPLLWLAVMALYPFLSALPQELIFRVFFFHRMQPLLGDSRLLTAASALCFAWLHVIFDNGIAPSVSLVGGLLLARTYRRTASLGAVSLEHALYGNLLFTLGWGVHFYRGL